MTWIRARVASTADDLKRSLADCPGAAKIRHPGPLIALYVGSQLFSFLLSANPTMDKTQRMIFIALPFFFLTIAWHLPAGLLVYWITTNAWTIGQG